jgi:hypothetical protein
VNVDRRDRLAIAGLATIAVVVPVSVDVHAIKHGHETISRFFVRVLLDPVLGPAAFAALAGLAWHIAQVTVDEVNLRNELAQLSAT